jgi:hypothetical protein
MSMKQFTTAVEDAVQDQEREDKILALMADKPDGSPGLSRKEAEEEVDPYIEFDLDGRIMRAYRPIEGQVIFMLAALGKGQSKESRFSSILNIMFESLREDDKDYLEGRLLSRDPKTRLTMKTIEGIFEFCVEGWFARPTQQPSDSAE